MIPKYVRTCIRLTMPARDWHRFEDCFAERYQQKLVRDGKKSAAVWARSECLWLFVELAKRLLHPRSWLGL